MSINSIGSGNMIVTSTATQATKQAQPQQGAVDVKSPSEAVSEEIADVIRITYPPFLPPGHTQTIFKDKK